MRGRAKIIAIKENVDLCPWADAVYGCDAPWWEHRRGLPELDGLKMCWAGNGLPGYPDIKRIEIEKTADRLLVDKIGKVGSGGNSGFQALNLAVQFGASRILLVGFDMHGQSGLHWYGRNTWRGANNPTDHNFERWIGAFASAVSVLKGLGVEVVNASANSALKSFPHRSIDDALQAWA